MHRRSSPGRRVSAIRRRPTGPGISDPAAASDYLRLFGLFAIAYLWARMAKVALAHIDDDPTGFYTAKLASARFYMARVLPETSTLAATISTGAAPLMAMEEAAF